MTGGHSSLSRKSKASGLTRCWFHCGQSVPIAYGNVCRAKRENEMDPGGRRLTFQSYISLVASIPANHRDQNSRANWRDWKWQCCRKGKSGSRQSYETDINSGYRAGLAGLLQPHPYSWHLLLGPPKAFLTRKPTSSH